jgi:lipopolysaccharide/colanic/teichoic acid biosynthesis glycosyltransferase
VQSGITGVWQVIGRNRVSFDEMTFQDLMYGMNRGLWVDLQLCLRTIPAALLGSGL